MAKKRSKKEVLQTITSHLCDMTYKERPVSMEEFLSNPEYLGTLTVQGSTVYPVWKKTLDIVSKEDSKYIVVLTGSIGSGKSRVAIWGMAYVMYRLLCMKNPWNYFGRAPGGKMAIVFFNLTKTLSSSKGFNLLQSCLLNSPWFRSHGIIVGSDNLPRIEFPLFEYKLGSPYAQGFGSVGEDVILADLDELDSSTESEKQRLRVLKMYENTVSRFKSRFVNDGESIGRLFLIASKQERMSFLNTFITEMKNSKNVYIVDIPLWEARPKSDYSGEKFYIMLGDVYTPSKILGSKDIEGKYSCSKEELDNVKRDGFGVLEVPIEYYDDFLRDIVLALRDIAGVSVNYLRKSKLFTSEKLLTDCYDSTKKDPVKKLTIEIGLRDNIDLINFLNLNDIRVPLNVPRFIHQDFGLTTDSLGLAMSCVRGWLKVNVPQQDGTFRVTKLPVVETDFVMRIKAKEADEIPQHKIRKLILDLKQVYKFNIVLCTFDLRLASADTMQILDNAGIKCEYFSVDKNPQVYLSYAEVVKEGRWVCHRNNYLHFELSNLEKDPVTGKIDHPEKVVDIMFLEDGNTKEIVLLGSKDCADAVAASTMKALENCQEPPDVEIMKNLMKRAIASSELDLTTNYDWVLGGKPKEEEASKNMTKKDTDNFKDLFRRSQQG